MCGRGILAGNSSGPTGNSNLFGLKGTCTKKTHLYPIHELRGLFNRSMHKSFA